MAHHPCDVQGISPSDFPSPRRKASPQGIPRRDPSGPRAMGANALPTFRRRPRNRQWAATRPPDLMQRASDPQSVPSGPFGFEGGSLATVAPGRGAFSGNGETRKGDPAGHLILDTRSHKAHFAHQCQSSKSKLQIGSQHVRLCCGSRVTEESVYIALEAPSVGTTFCQHLACRRAFDDLFGSIEDDLASGKKQE